MTFRIRPYDRSRKRAERTPAQEAATQRNFRIFRLRSLWALAYVVSDKGRRGGIQALIDAELVSLGALPQRDHEWAQLQKAQQHHPDPEPISEDEIPF